jgi:hypothetical protein
VLLAPPLYLASFIGSFASPLPLNDQWDVAPLLLGLKQGHFSLERLFAFHNEHLIVIPRLCFAALSFVFTWNNRNECWFTSQAAGLRYIAATEVDQCGLTTGFQSPFLTPLL